MGTTTDDDDATDDGRSAVVGRSTTAGAKQKMNQLMMKYSYGTSGAILMLLYTHSNIIILYCTTLNFVL